MSKKRGNNEGSIYKRQDGRWAATVSLGYEGGKRKRKTVYGKTRKGVAERLLFHETRNYRPDRVQKPV